ncbi:hypothetical protein BH11MYX1_BH11MYX1_36560 [soil metagenome]
MTRCMIHGTERWLASLCAVQLVGCFGGDDAAEAPLDAGADLQPVDAPDTSEVPVAGGTTYTFSGGDFKAALEKLRPGDVLKIGPGTYDLRTAKSNGIAPNLTPGTAAAPILVTAADPNNWPHFLGQLVLDHPSYYTFKRLRVQLHPRRRAGHRAGS